MPMIRLTKSVTTCSCIMADPPMRVYFYATHPSFPLTFGAQRGR